MSCLGIITARGGSKGVKDKNLRPLGGGPSLVQRAARVGQACPRIDTVAITTDSPAIRDQALAEGAEAPFLRPAELSGDAARQEDAIIHLMGWYEAAGRQFDQICILSPTTPFLKAETLVRGFERLQVVAEATAVMALKPAVSPPFLCNRWTESDWLEDFPDRKLIWANRQEFPAYYTLASGLVAISRWGSFLEERTMWQRRAVGIEVDPAEAFDIDTPWDFLVADFLARGGIDGTPAAARALARLGEGR
jgi:CMP-N-acetylneuraminic acid synthetase